MLIKVDSRHSLPDCSPLVKPFTVFTTGVALRRLELYYARPSKNLGIITRLTLAPPYFSFWLRVRILRGLPGRYIKYGRLVNEQITPV